MLTKKFKYYDYNYNDGYMATTIQVSETTKQMLHILKEKEHAATFDQLIKELVQEKMKVPRSMFGAVKGWKWNKETDRAKTHDELYGP